MERLCFIGATDARCSECWCLNHREPAGCATGKQAQAKMQELTDPENVTWYKSSEKVRRGFCSTCGSSLFWDPLDTKKNDWTAISLRAFDAPTKTRLRRRKKRNLKIESIY